MDNITVASKVKELFDINLRECKLLGKGRFGKVYFLPVGRVLKVFKDELSCIKDILMFTPVMIVICRTKKKLKENHLQCRIILYSKR